MFATPVPEILFKFGLGLSIPGVGKVDPTIGVGYKCSICNLLTPQYEKGETDLVLTGDSSSGTTDQAAYVYEKVQGNADTDENSKLVHLEFYKVMYLYPCQNSQTRKGSMSSSGKRL